MRQTNGNGRRRISAALILLLPLLISGPSLQGQQPASAQLGSAAQGFVASNLGTRFAGSGQPVKLHVNQYRSCFAMAPANWTIYGERREGDALDIAAPTMAASWTVVGVPGFMIRLDPYRYGTPEARITESLTRQFRGLPVAYGEPMRDDFGYTWLPYESGDAKGVVIYQAWLMPYDPPGYVMVSRIAQTVKSLWEHQGAEAIAVALSIRCTRQLQPSAVGGTGSTVDEKLESTYNHQLGMEYAHDAATGDNYWVSTSADWHNDGPEGPGYYKRSGNELRKLAPGRSD